jgi:hypothetical protein
MGSSYQSTSWILKMTLMLETMLFRTVSLCQPNTVRDASLEAMAKSLDLCMVLSGVRPVSKHSNPPLNPPGFRTACPTRSF